MNTAERKALREKHETLAHQKSDWCWNADENKCDVIKVLDYLDLVDPHTEQSVQVEPENTEHNNCKHTQGHWLEVNGENYGFVLNFYCPKCGEKL